MYKGETLACLLLLDKLNDVVISKKVESFVESNHDILKELDIVMEVEVVAKIGKIEVTPFLKVNIDVLDL